jgi:aspartate aminotransferase
MNLLARDIIDAPTDIAFSEYLLESADVAVVPGSAFGAEGYIRLSFATSQANLEKALARITAALA